MNMDLDIVNRALLHVGQAPLTEIDRRDNSTAYQAAKLFYLPTFLEALSEVEWAGGRKRSRLVVTGLSVIPDQRYRFAYDMPYDCARPVELQGNEYFSVEDRIIFSDAPDAELLYVSTGRILRPLTVFSGGSPGQILESDYLTGGPPAFRPDVILYSGGPEDLPPSPDDPVPTDEFPDYLKLDYEPKFYEYIERALAAKFALKMTEQPQVRLELLQEAMVIKQEAMNASAGRLAAKIKPVKWWTEEMTGEC
jgi:hypothetical protein